MHFNTKNTLKNNHNHTSKQPHKKFKSKNQNTSKKNNNSSPEVFKG